ncbi:MULTISPECIES: molybdopterin cofactor-binding domain-containing protein [Giesbergeria]|uniref:Molybdopterin cofactor-binding domain-containing protein n=1 Tax=Giesbergeria sinuosa TaxID=80883 RepID=A0ABV9Q922_9BURK
MSTAPLLPSSLQNLAQGKTRFTSDLSLPQGCLHALPATSPHAHARFSQIDSAAALAVPGVRAILTAADILRRNDISNLAHDEPLLAEQEVHCVGEPYALVVADSIEAAWQGSHLVTADWTPLPACLDMASALAAGALLQPPRTFALGDVDTAWGCCAIVVSGTVEIGSAEHLYMETQCALALPRDDGGLLLHSATQSPSGVHKAVATITGLPMHAIEVVAGRLGGGFGGKEEQATLWACLAALAAQRLQQPVRLWPDRSDDMRITGKRHPYQAHFKLGLDANGRFVAYEAQLWQNAGWCTDLSPAILERSLFHATNAYAIPHVRVTAHSCRTHLPSNTAFRGFGAPQAIFVMESAIRAAAHQLRCPPETLQARNLLRDGDVFPYGMCAQQPKAEASWQMLARENGIATCRQRITAWNATQPRYRKGMAVVPVCFGIAFTATLLNQAQALVHVYTDGSVAVTTGAIEMGQGVHGKVQRIVAETLGLPVAQVQVMPTSTLRVANVSPTAASTGADLNGGAARQACLDILQRLRPVAAALLNAPAAEVMFLEGHAHAQQARVPWNELIAQAYRQRIHLSALAHYASANLHFDPQRNQGQPFAYHVYGTALMEATVDVLLGTGRIDAVRVVHDIGHSLDASTDRGQIEGAIVQGMGWMTSEEIRHDSQGRLLTDNLASYKIPDLDSSPPIEIEFLPHNGGPAGILHSKAVGEPPLVYGLAAYFALQDAITSWQPQAAAVFRAPLTSEAIFGLLHGNDPP